MALPWRRQRPIAMASQGFYLITTNPKRLPWASLALAVLCCGILLAPAPAGAQIEGGGYLGDYLGGYTGADIRTYHEDHPPFLSNLQDTADLVRFQYLLLETYLANAQVFYVCTNCFFDNSST